MLKKHTQVFSTILRFSDIGLSFAAWELAYQLRFYWIDLPHASDIPLHEEYLKASLVISILTGIVFSISGVYRLQKIIQPKQELFHLLRGTFTLILLTSVVAFFYREFSFSRIHIIYFLSSFLILLLLSRLVTRFSLRYLHSKNTYIENILIIGDGISASKFTKNLERLKSLGIVLKGVIEIESEYNSRIPPNIARLGKIEQLEQIIKANQIDQVFIALPSNEQYPLTKLKELLGE